MTKRQLSTAYQVRDATAADLECLVDGNVRLARETEHIALDVAVVRAGVEGVFARPERGRYWVAMVDGEPVGQAMVTTEWSDWRAGDVWWFQSVYVWPAHRRRGVFRALHDHVVAAARAAGARGVRLYVEHGNHTAQATYAALGIHPADYVMCERMFGPARVPAGPA